MKLTKQDHDFCIKACNDSMVTSEERQFLSNCASLYAANECANIDAYTRMQRLTGSLLTVDGSIFDRLKPANMDQVADYLAKLGYTNLQIAKTNTNDNTPPFLAIFGKKLNNDKTEILATFSIDGDSQYTIDNSGVIYLHNNIFKGNY